MPAIAAPVSVYPGDSLSISFRFRNANSTPFDLSGWAWRSWWAPKVGVIGKTEMTVQATPGRPGELTIKATPEQTAKMAVAGNYDLRGTDSSGNVWTILRGPTKGMKGITS